jgi:hypothetical protein
MLSNHQVTPAGLVHEVIHLAEFIGIDVDQHTFGKTGS